MKTPIVVLGLTAATLAACAATPMAAPDVPAAIAVPSGHSMAMMAMGAGDLAYECRAKANAAGVHEWAFVGPDAVLYDSASKPVGKYYGGPTWESNDGSKVTGKQLAVAPGASGSIPLQLVQANPSTGKGSMQGVTYIQRINTQGGVAPTDACNAASLGQKRTVKYKADYVFYKAAESTYYK